SRSRDGGNKEESSSFLKKEPKNFLSIGIRLPLERRVQTDRSFFASFFSKKEGSSFPLDSPPPPSA
ncbi:MAG: hypothetical protein Q8M47_02200, partial [Devosia sp.]|nr:hypothetical protein [Devosia sp.]